MVKCVTYFAQVKIVDFCNMTALKNLTLVPKLFGFAIYCLLLNLGLVCVLFCTLCYLYSLVKMYCGALFYLV